MIANAGSRFETQEINTAVIESYGNEVIDYWVRTPSKALNVNVSVWEKEMRTNVTLINCRSCWDATWRTEESSGDQSYRVS